MESTIRRDSSPLLAHDHHLEAPPSMKRPGLVKSLVMVVCGVVFPLLCAGLIFGFAALKPILIKTGVYHDLCEPSEVSCEAQKLKLDLMFTLAAAATNAFALPIGTTLDKFGPRITLCIGAIIFGCGCLLFGMASPSFDLYIPGFLGLAIGGPFIFISLLHLCNLFPSYAGLIMGFSTGAFDSSSCIFPLFAYMFEMGFTLRELFLGYISVAVIVFFVGILLMPDRQYGHVIEGGPDANAVSSKTYCHSIQQESVHQQLLSKEFWLLVAFMSLYMLRLNFYIATVQDQIEEMDISEGPKMAKFFSVLLPLGGALAVPLIGFYLDRRGIIASWYALGWMGIVFGGCSVVSNVPLQYFSMFVFAILRPFLYTAGSFYVGHMFGFHNFGKVYGTMVFLTAVVNTSQYGLDALVKFCFQGHFLVVNVGLTALGVVVLYFPYFLGIHKLRILSQYSSI